MNTPPSIRGRERGWAPQDSVRQKTSKEQGGHLKTQSGFTVGDVINGRRIVGFKNNEQGLEVALLTNPTHHSARMEMREVPIEELLQCHIDEAGEFKIGDRVKATIDGHDREYEIQGFTVIDRQMRALVGYTREEDKTHDINANWISVAELKKGQSN